VVAGRLTVNPDGRVTGPANIHYNNPFPTVNGSYGSGAMLGCVMHTMVGDLPGTVEVFNNPSFEASAHFGIAQNGEIWQFGPIGRGWVAWAQEAGNEAWYSVENADAGNPDNPLTVPQMTALAQVLECLSAFAGFPLRVTDSPAEPGFGVHFMGGAAWGGHTCPDLPPRAVRSAQRPAVIALAEQIRSGHPPAPGPGPVPVPAKGADMIIVQVDQSEVPAGTTWPGVFLLAADGTLHHITTSPDVNAYKAAGLAGPVTISWAEYQARTAA
jgi:N-acetylmuramoyl-L-alanine amidase